ncbi:Rab geranylgeranyltransferase [Saccharomycopsis crataegensis]|uniref:Geranylgeranyl transferase type-2 subunit beta n=1 Tax=Saccharomycopsis crataegensis TaxID=43959 RepID=A0AAV5QMV5_9ASCO|nr:Rab geranylgeranyltransferase [Saccharomycopsis crataegensis]
MTELAVQKHIDYVVNLNKHTRDYEYWLTEHLRLNGLYWGLTALFMLNAPDVLDKKDIVKYVLSCRDSRSGAFGAFPKHDGHLLSTLSGLQILVMLGELDTALTDEDKSGIIKFIKDNQLPDGSFQGDKYGEIDTRFVYNAISSLSLLGELTDDVVEPAVKFILRCQNFDGGFGLVPGAESHAAQIFTCLGSLAIADRLHYLSEEKQELLAWWLSERQQDSFNNSKEFEGGLNGRPEKLPDVCYSWWVLSSLSILKRVEWIDKDKLRRFILSSQDLETGGISDRPDNQVDVFHTVFGLAGLSLTGHPGLDAIDPVYCMPVSITSSLKKWKN